MSDKMTQYFDAYYGTPIPASQQSRIREPFTTMIKTIQSDIQGHLVNISKEDVKAGLLEALRYMNSTEQLDYPDLYIRNPRVATEAFRYAVAAAMGKPIRRARSAKEASDALEREREATMKKIEDEQMTAEENAKIIESRSKIAAELYRMYNKDKQAYMKNGDAPIDAKLKAYANLVNAWEWQGGIDYYIVGMKIPMEEGIYHELAVINTMNAHPQLSHMNRSPDEVGNGMRINNQRWAGLRG